MAALALIGWVAYSWTTQLPGHFGELTPRQKTRLLREAFTRSHDFVLDYLIAPTVAAFPKHKGNAYVLHAESDSSVVPIAVTGKVDAPNEAGVPLRKEFFVGLTYDLQSGTWSRMALVLDGEVTYMNKYDLESLELFGEALRGTTLIPVN